MKKVFKTGMIMLLTSPNVDQEHDQREHADARLNKEYRTPPSDYTYLHFSLVVLRKIPIVSTLTNISVDFTLTF